MRKIASKFSFSHFLLGLCASVALLLPAATFSQQTLGGITGTVTDASGAAIADTQVTLVAEATKLTRSQTTNSSGSYDFVSLPIGAYSLTFTHDGFETLVVPSIVVQADRTATLNASLKVGAVGSAVTVEATPLMNSEDTTNGYILEKDEISSVPLATGSFTSLAILSPGVNAELPSGTGANSGLGNQPIWANGQRDTSNSFLTARMCSISVLCLKFPRSRRIFRWSANLRMAGPLKGLAFTRAASPSASSITAAPSAVSTKAFPTE